MNTNMRIHLFKSKKFVRLAHPIQFGWVGSSQNDKGLTCHEKRGSNNAITVGRYVGYDERSPKPQLAVWKSQLKRVEEGRLEKSSG